MKKRKDGRYVVTMTIDGKRKAIYGKTRPEVIEKLKKFTRKEQNGATFGEVAEDWWQTQMERAERGLIRQTTLKNYKPHYERIRGIYGDMPIKDITGEHIKNTLSQAASAGYSRTVVNSVRVILNGILTHGCEKGLILVNPAASIPLPSRLPKGKRRAPTEEETRVILSHRSEPFDFYVFFLLISGLRRSEALALHKDDFAPDLSAVKVRRSLVYPTETTPTESTPKTESSARTVRLPSVMTEPLRAYLATVKGTYVFPRRYEDGRVSWGLYETERTIRREWNEYRARYGLPDDLTLHCLRHGTATLLFEAGVDIHTAKEQLGHSNINTTMTIYEELRAAQRQRSIDKFDAALTEALAGE